MTTKIRFAFRFHDVLVLKDVQKDDFILAPTESFSQRQIAKIATSLCKERWKGSGVREELVRIIVRESLETLVLFSKSKKKIVGIACFDVVDDTYRNRQELTLFCTNTKGYARELMDLVVTRYKQRNVKNFVTQPNSWKLYKWYRSTWPPFNDLILKTLDGDRAFLTMNIQEYEEYEEMRKDL